MSLVVVHINSLFKTHFDLLLSLHVIFFTLCLTFSHSILGLPLPLYKPIDFNIQYLPYILAIPAHN